MIIQKYEIPCRKEAIKCTECGQKFTNLKNLKRHKKTFHKKIKTDETENLEGNCEKCEMLSKGESTENLRHTQNCEKRDKKRKKCEKLLKGENNDELRLSQNCTKKGKKDKHCDECGQEFQGSYNLKRHKGR